MKALIQALLLLIGLVGGLYVGIYVMCFGGIVDVINSIKETPLDTIQLAVGIVKFLFASIVGWSIFYFTLMLTAIID